MRLPFFLCAICKAPSRQPICDPCWPALVRAKWPVVRDERDFLIRSLYSWHPQGPRGLTWLAHSLKRRPSPEWWRSLAGLFLHEFPLPQPSVLVPIPSASPDHALGFARALAELSGADLATGRLLRIGPSGQKSRNRDERQQIRFAPGETCNSYKTVVIVDDVVTTGATARAAVAALKASCDCEVWTLLDRRPCGGS